MSTNNAINCFVLKPVTSTDCKRAITDYLKQNFTSFSHRMATEWSPPAPTAPALVEKNWKRRSKEKNGNVTIRMFDCVPYDDQLRAYVADNGTTIVEIEISFE